MVINCKRIMNSFSDVLHNSLLNLVVVLACSTSLVMASSCSKKTIDKESAPHKSISIGASPVRIISEAQQDTLLKIGRSAIAHYFKTNSIGSAPSVNDVALNRNHGCLVRISVDNMVRGSAGYILPIKSLVSGVSELAVRAACDKSHIGELKKEELSRAVISITVVSDPVPINSPSEIRMKVNGLVMVSDSMAIKGIFMPEEVAQAGSGVAAVDKMLAMSQLSRNAITENKVKVFTFTLQEFAEVPFSKVK